MAASRSHPLPGATCQGIRIRIPLATLEAKSDKKRQKASHLQGEMGAPWLELCTVIRVWLAIVADQTQATAWVQNTFQSSSLGLGGAGLGGAGLGLSLGLSLVLRTGGLDGAGLSLALTTGGLDGIGLALGLALGLGLALVLALMTGGWGGIGLGLGRTTGGLGGAGLGVEPGVGLAARGLSDVGLALAS